MWLRSLLTSLKSRPSVATFRRSRRACTPRLAVEVLDDRCLPSTFTVTNLLDSGAGSLRAAVVAANANPGADSIDFATTGTGTLTSGKLDITDSVTINGPGAGALTLTVSSNHLSSVFDVAASTIDVNIHDLTIANSGGSTIGNIDVGAIYNAGTLTMSNCTLSGNATYTNNSSGGGIYNAGTLTVRNCTLSGNSSPYGGGIYNTGTLTVSNSTLSGNGAYFFSTDGLDFAPAGGAIFSTGTLTVTNSTISNNGAIGGSYYVYSQSDPYSYITVGTDASAGGLFVSGTAFIDHSTIASNNAFGGYGDPGFEGTGYGGGIVVNNGGIAFNNGSQGQLYDSILADNTGYYPDLAGNITSLGHNLIGNSTGGSGFAATDLLNVDPRLGPLQDNGGPMKTMGLRAGSPALDAGDTAGAPAYDQRGPGFPRVLGSAIDIGAVEGQTQAPPPALVISNVALREGNSGTTAFVFTVSLSAPSDQAVSVNYATADDTATAGSDYQAASGRLTIPAGQTTGTITVLVNGDRLPEQNRTFFVNLSSPTNATIAFGQGEGTIVDDDPLITIRDVTVTEGNTGTRDATFTVSLSVACEEAVTVNYATADGTATAGSDYRATSGTLRIPAGQTTGTITVQVNGDRRGEPNETFFVNLSSPTNATLADGQGVGTILDDEPRISISDVTKKEGRRGQTTLFTFTFTLSAAYDQAVTMSYRTVDGTAKTSDQDYVAKTGTLTFAPGETTKTIRIEVKGDNKKEADEMFYLDLSGLSSNALFAKNRGTGTILNDD
jgi:hypothetical protein